VAINDALAEVERSGDLQVPMSIRNAPTKLMKELGYGDEYKYAHSYEGNFAEQEFLPEDISGKTFYSPGGNQRESGIRDWLRKLWKSKYGY
jgi:putative ATPase